MDLSVEQVNLVSPIPGVNNPFVRAVSKFPFELAAVSQIPVLVEQEKSPGCMPP